MTDCMNEREGGCRGFRAGPRIQQLEKVIKRLEAMYREAREKGYDLSCPIRAWNDRTEKAIAAAKAQ